MLNPETSYDSAVVKVQQFLRMKKVTAKSKKKRVDTNHVI